MRNHFYSDKKYSYQTIFFSLIGLCVVGQLYLPIPIIEYLQKQYKLDNASWIISVFGYCYAMGFLFFGPISDKIGKRKVLILGMIVLLMVTFILSRIENGKILIIFRGIQGFFAASFPPIILAYIGEEFPENRRGIAISSMAFCFLSAVIISQLYIVYVSKNSLIFAELTLSIAYFAALLFLLFTIKKTPINNQRSIIKIFINSPKILFNKNLLFFYIYTFFILMAFVSFYLIFSIGNLNLTNNLFLIRLVGLPAMLICFSVPKLIQRTSTILVINLAFILQGIAMSFSSLAFYIESEFILMLASILISSATAILVTTLIAQISINSTPENRGTAVALYTFILFCGASSAPLLINWVKLYFDEITISLGFAIISTILFMINQKSKRDS